MRSVRETFLDGLANAAEVLLMGMIVTASAWVTWQGLNYLVGLVYG